MGDDLITARPHEAEPTTAPIVTITEIHDQAQPGAGILPISNNACRTGLPVPARAMVGHAHDPEGEDSVNKPFIL